MKANELMLNDWVCYDGDTDYECPLRVDGVSCDDVSIEGEGFLGGVNGVVVPIPLTEEILKVNGFEIYGHHAMLYVNNDMPEEVSIHIDYAESYDINSPDYRLSGLCKYVHELQHALRICGLAELADEFRIE